MGTGLKSLAAALSLSLVSGCLPAYDLDTRLKALDAEGNRRSTFSEGERIVFELKATNRAPRSVTCFFSDGQTYEFEVYAKGADAPLWVWSHDYGFTQAVWQMDLAPNESRSYSVEWSQEGGWDSPVGPGSYVVRGYFPPGENPVLAAFTIE